MTLYLRISDTRLSFATYRAERPKDFRHETFHIQPQASLTANLREAMSSVSLIKEPHDKIEILVSTIATPVPISEFQEEYADAIWKLCFTHNDNERIFYDTAPAADIALLYAVDKAACHTIEETLGEVRYTSTITPLVQHFATKALGVSQGKRVFAHIHGGATDVLVFEDTRLLALNTYKVRALPDIAYYTLNLAKNIGADLADTPFFVAGEETQRNTAVSELEKYASRVYPINPAAEFNRNPVSMHRDVAYDMMCALIRQDIPRPNFRNAGGKS